MAPADGDTLLVNASIHGINPYVYASAPYDAFRDFEPVTQLVDVPLVLVVGNALPARNLQELVAHARAHPGQANFGSAGNAPSQHLSGELFRMKTGAQMQHVPYKGSSPALTDEGFGGEGGLNRPYSHGTSGGICRSSSMASYSTRPMTKCPSCT